MITKLAISNYRSLDYGVELRPGPLSVLVGPNGSGKSNVLDVLAFVREAVLTGLSAAITHRGGIDSVRRRSPGHPYDVQVELELKLENGPASYSFVITGDRLEEYRVKSENAVVNGPRGSSYFTRSGADWKDSAGFSPRMDEQSLALTALGGALPFKPLVDFLSNMVVYSVFPDTLRAPQKFDPSRPMKKHGENWVSVLRELVKIEDDKRDLVVGLSKLTGDIEDVKVTSAASHLIAEFKQNGRAQKAKSWFDAAGQSDGTLRVAGLLTALLQTPHLPVIGVEEPELTVHPGVLPMLVDYLRQASEASQVFVTTHSPIILDMVEVEKEPVFVVSRLEGRTCVKRVTDTQLAPVRQSLLSLGDLFVSGDLQLSLFDDQVPREE